MSNRSRAHAMNPSKARVLADDTDCGGCNDGQCIEPSISILSTNYVNPSSFGSQPSCDCKNTGFIGEHCEVPCSKDCQNGGKCLPATESEYGVEFCSCSKAVVDGNPFVGLLCEYGATKSCMTIGSESKHSFCTNGGDCAEIVGDNERHKDCICEVGYEGSHCEFVIGTSPIVKEVEAGRVEAGSGVSAAKGGSNMQSSQANTATSDMIVVIMICVVGALIAVLLLAYGVRARKKRTDAKRQEKEAREATEELSMIPTHNEPQNDII